MNPDLYKEILEHLYDGLYFVDQNMQITYWNKSAEKITGYAPLEVMGCKCSDNILRHINDNGDELCIKGCPLGRTLKDGQLREADVYLHHKEGHRVPVSIRVSPIRDKQGKIIGAAEIFSNNTRKLDMLNELEVLKNHVYTDELTLVGNRRFAELTLNARFNELKTYTIPFGILFFDLNDFKNINDNYGHGIGDKVLKMVGTTTLNIIRSLDVVCRWGGDEFMVVTPNVDTNALRSIADKIKMFVEKTWIASTQGMVRVTLSVGGAMARTGDNPENLIRKADLLMYESKKNGGTDILID